MDFFYSDFNEADRYFTRRGRARWLEIESVLLGLTPQFQPSDQKERLGRPIFDPKATNAALTFAAAAAGWSEVRVPAELRSFGQGWDGGKGVVLAEWQFSNYPFLWNNITRSEIVARDKVPTPPLTGPAEALIVVTKSGMLPASNSTLYFEQANSQMERVTALGMFQLPIRLVGLCLPDGARSMTGVWNTYGARYGRVPAAAPATFDLAWRDLGGEFRRAVPTLRDI